MTLSARLCDPKVLAGLLLLPAVAYLTYVFTVVPPNFSDTEVYRGAGMKAWEHLTAYDVEGHYTFNYPPFAALFYAFTLARFPLPIATWGFYVLSLLGWAALAALFSQEVVREKGIKGERLALIAVGVLLFALFFAMGLRDELKLGQTMIVPFLAVFGFYRAQRRAEATGSLVSQITAGLLLAFAIQIKIYFAVLVPVVAFRKQWTVLATVVLSHFLLYNGLALALFHGADFALAENLRWVRAMTSASQNLLADHHNVSLASLLAKLGLPPAVVRLGAGAVIAAFVGVQWRFRRRSLLCLVALSLAAVPLLNPIAWPYWMLLGFPLLHWVVFSALKLKTESFFLGFLGGYWVLSQLQNTLSRTVNPITLATMLLLAYAIRQENRVSC
jgi:hypothetical protein